jgi:DNA-binding response OmpR family regulator
MGLFDFLKRATVKSEPQPLGQFERRKKDRKNPNEGSSILVVDDSVTIVSALRQMLDQRNKYVVHTAMDGETALEMAHSHMPDLIFLDLVLPGISGFEVLRKLRKNELTREIPIIIMSGNEAAIEQFYVQRIGADDFIKKPFSRAEVYARVEALIDESGSLRRTHVNEASANPAEM